MYWWCQYWCRFKLDAEYGSSHRRTNDDPVLVMTSSNLNIFCVTGHLCGEFTGPRWIPHSKANDAELWYFGLRLNKRLSKQLWGWWFETLPRPLWRHSNVRLIHVGPRMINRFSLTFIDILLMLCLFRMLSTSRWRLNSSEHRCLTRS